jgi:hypothetical protein
MNPVAPFEVPPVQKRHIMTGWRHHPGVPAREQLSAEERAADLVRNGMGTWPVDTPMIVNRRRSPRPFGLLLRFVGKGVVPVRV